MNSPELLGYCASIASGEFMRALRTRQTRDLSLQSVALAACGTVLWATYGYVIGSTPVLLSNLIVMPLAMATLAIKLQGMKVD